LPVDVDGSLLDEFPTDSLLLEGHEAEVLWLVVLHLVDGADELGHNAEIAQVTADVFFGYSIGDFTQVDLAGLHVSFLHGRFFTHDAVILAGGRLKSGHFGEEDEREPPAPACCGVHLQLNSLQLSVLAKVLLEVILTAFRRKSSNEELAVIFISSHGHFVLSVDLKILL